jgi:hypothetical protein
VGLKDGTAGRESWSGGAEAGEGQQECLVSKHGGYLYGEAFLKSLAAMVGELQKLAEDTLLSDTDALAAQDPAVLRVVTIRRRMVELSVKLSARLRVRFDSLIYLFLGFV